MHESLELYGARTVQWDFFFKPEYQLVDDSDSLEDEPDSANNNE